MTFTNRRAPLWFEVCVAVALALGLRAIEKTLAGGLPADGHAPHVELGFWFFITLIAGAIWKGLEVAGRVTLIALGWSVKALWWFASTTYNGLKAVGSGLLFGLKKSWEFLRLTYDSVIKPGLVKFWQWFDKFRHWLDNTFGPVLDFLKMVRDNVVLFYKTWIRPWLDLIDVTRRVLRIFAAMGLDWARTLDAKLGQLQELIDRPFRLLLAEINKVINTVNRIVTLDGLIQRVALLRSIARDYQYVWNSLNSVFHRPITGPENDVIAGRTALISLSATRTSFEEYVERGTGPDSARIDELALSIDVDLRGKR